MLFGSNFMRELQNFLQPHWFIKVQSNTLRIKLLNTARQNLPPSISLKVFLAFSNVIADALETRLQELDILEYLKRKFQNSSLEEQKANCLTK